MTRKATCFQLDDPELLELVSPEMDRWLNSWPAEQQARKATRDTTIIIACATPQ